jgi:hypothetical protein
MQQRRLRLGDILDDYCPRERRITNHAVVAMIEDEVQQTRCATCDADHEYKHARAPTPRRRKPEAAIEGSVAVAPRPAIVAPAAEPATGEPVAEEPAGGPGKEVQPEQPDAVSRAAAAGDASDPPATDDDGPVHRRLIRATLPRPEGQPPPQEWKEPEFTVRQPGNGSRDQRRPGRRGRGRRRGQQPGSGPPSRFGQESEGQGRREADGNREPSSQRDGGRGRGPRQGGGHKRGR